MLHKYRKTALIEAEQVLGRLKDANSKIKE